MISLPRKQPGGEPFPPTPTEDILAPLPRAWEGKPAHNAYPEEVKQQAIDLALSLKSVSKAAKETGVPARTIYVWLAEEHLTNALGWDLTTSRELEGKIDRILERIGPDKIEQAGLRDLAVSLGILLDKRQALRPKQQAGPPAILRVAWSGGKGAVEISPLEDK